MVNRLQLIDKSSERESKMGGGFDVQRHFQQVIQHDKYQSKNLKIFRCTAQLSDF